MFQQICAQPKNKNRKSQSKKQPKKALRGVVLGARPISPVRAHYLSVGAHPNTYMVTGTHF